MTRRAGRAAALVALASAACGAPISSPAIVEIDLHASGSASGEGTHAESDLPPVHVVRLRAGASLAALLREQGALAASSGERLVVMTSGARCPACRRFLGALEAAPLRAALRGVVLVRVEVPRFERELASLGLASYVLPAFFLIDDEGRARDGITSSEWTDDLPENIAPVLGAFANGAYVDRRAPLTR